MTRRFTVIQGGLSEVSTAVPAAGAITTRRLDHLAAETVEAAAVGVCRSVRVGNAARDPRRGFDHRMPPVRHRLAGRDAGQALAWSRDAETGASSGLASPLVSPSLRGERAAGWQPAGCAAIAADETAVARAVDRALRVRLASLRGSIRLVGSVEPVRAATPARPASAASAAARPRAIPAGAFVGLRPQDWEAPASGMRGLSTPDRSGGTDEPVLSFDTPAAERPVIAEPAERPSTGAARSLIVLRRAGAAVAKALRLGAAGARLPWRQPRS